MANLRKLLTALGLLLLLGAGFVAPRIDAEHIFAGGINRRGKPVGFHSRPGGRDPANARVVTVVRGPNPQGVYEARVVIRERAGAPWREKRSTFYPDRLSREDVLAAITNAYRQRTTGRAERFRGSSGLGFTIEGYHRDGFINTAYPIYR
jgi:hypothetical protein